MSGRKPIPVMGDTDKEREWFAMGYRLGMIRANEILADLANERGELTGACPAGACREAYNRVSVEIPTGKIRITYTMDTPS